MKSLAELLPIKQSVENVTVTTAEKSPHCKDCFGSGYMGIKTPDNYPMDQVEFCSCQMGSSQKEFWDKKIAGKKRTDLESTLDAAGIPPRYRNHRIGDWDGDNQAAVNHVRSYIKDGSVNGKDSILLYGDYGCGKTSLLVAGVIGRIEGGDRSPALFIKGNRILDEVQATYSRGSEHTKIAVIDKYAKSPVLFIDEFGNGFQSKEFTEDKIAIFTDIITYRYDWNLPTLITSNINLEVMQDLLKTPQITDRFLQSYAIAKMVGVNRRLPEKFR